MKHANTFSGVAYDYTTTLAGLVKSYKTTSALKKDYSALVNLYGKEEAVRLMKGYKAARAKEVSEVMNEAKSHLTVQGLMSYAFKEIKKGGDKNGALARLQSVYGQTERVMDYEGFLAKYYPYTMEGGKPAQAVWYTRDGSEVYKVYEPLVITTENAVKVLNRALDSLERGAQKVYVSGKARRAWTQTFKAREIVSVCASKITHEVLRNEAGEVLKDSYKVERGEKVEFPEGLALTADHVTVKEFTKTLNASEE